MTIRLTILPVLLLGTALGQYPLCNCPPGSWPAPDQQSCISSTGCRVPGMPNGDKGGNYFADGGSLFQRTACIPQCEHLLVSTKTGQSGWKLVSGPGVPVTGAASAITPNAGWGTIPGAQWVGVDASVADAGYYVFEYPFCLCPTATFLHFQLQFLADNGAEVQLIRPAQTPQTLFATVGDANFKGTPHVVNYSGAAVPGQNVIRIIVRNDGIDSGLLAALELNAPGGKCAACVVGPGGDVRICRETPSSL